MRITYLCPSDSSPTGGIKVIYRHAELLSAHGVASYIFHPDKPEFNAAWFKHKATVRRERRFDAKQDFVVIPEVGARLFGDTCLQGNIKYAIFVQGGYLISKDLPPAAEGNLRGIYEGAALIASISEDTTAMIRLTFPGIAETKIVRLLPGIGDRFSPGFKKKVITFMPRKLPLHAERLCFLLRQHLPADWSLVSIHDRSEDDVAALLAESSIFLSLCDQEGLPLPPLEAAFAGNIVVGYTGQGAKEYFHQPIFREVINGDYRTYVASVLQAIADVEARLPAAGEFQRQRGELKHRYSGETELAHLLKFAERAEQCFALRE